MLLVRSLEYQGRTGLQANALEIVRKRERVTEAKTRRQKLARVHVPDERGDEIRRQGDSSESDTLENELAHTAARFHARRDFDRDLPGEKLQDTPISTGTCPERSCRTPISAAGLRACRDRSSPPRWRDFFRNGSKGSRSPREADSCFGLGDRRSVLPRRSRTLSEHPRRSRAARGAPRAFSRDRHRQRPGT